MKKPRNTRGPYLIRKSKNSIIKKIEKSVDNILTISYEVCYIIRKE